jgi:LuxR family maltose regulon positive regulatory protein
VLSVHYAGVLLQNGALAGVEERLRDAERWLKTTAETDEGLNAQPMEMVVGDDAEFRRLQGAIAMYRAGCALALGDVAGTMRHARRALDLAPEDDHFLPGAAASLLGLASWTSGDLEAAHRSYADGMASLQRAGFITDVVGGALALADIRIGQGRLHEAMRAYERALQLATAQGGPVLRGTADMHVGMAELYRERNDLDAATRHLQTSTELGEHLGLPQHPYRWRVAMARLREARGDADGALELLGEAERRHVIDLFPNVRPVAAVRTRVWIAQGRLDEALGWAREQGLSAEDDLSYLREFEHLTLARLLLARSQRDRVNHSLLEARGLLERLLTAADAGERMGSVIQILVLQALTHRQLGDVPAALASLERALRLAEPEGYVRTFVDEGESLRHLLRRAAGSGPASGYARRLLRAFDEPPRLPSVPAPAAALAEPLTAREVEILRLIAAGMRNQEIADQLYISLPTVKRHLANAYGKLGVGHRTEAVARVNALNLL